MREPGATRRELAAPDGLQDAIQAQACLRRGVPEPYEAQDEIPDAPPAQGGFQHGFQGASPEQDETPSALRERGFRCVAPKHGFQGVPRARAFHCAPPEHEFRAVPQEPWFRNLYGSPDGWSLHAIQGALRGHGFQDGQPEHGLLEWRGIRNVSRAHAIPAALRVYGL